MPTTIVTAVKHKKSECVRTYGTETDIQKYLDLGYSVENERNGYWVLAKPSQINVTLSNGNVTETIDMREGVLEFYNRKRVTDNLFCRFIEEIKSGKLHISLNPDNTYSFLKN